MKHQQLHILAIDDTPDILQLIKVSLEMATNWQVQTVSSSHEGLLIAQQKLPDLIISDVRMPKMDGFEIAQQLRSQVDTQHIPVLFMTSIPELVSARQRQLLNIKKVIAKPFDTLTLADSIVSALT